MFLVRLLPVLLLELRLAQTIESIKKAEPKLRLVRDRSDLSCAPLPLRRHGAEREEHLHPVPFQDPEAPIIHVFSGPP